MLPALFAHAVVAKPSHPHVVYIMGDDVGWYNVGWHGNPEIKTPNMSALVAEGVELDRVQYKQRLMPSLTSMCNYSARYTPTITAVPRGVHS